MAVIVLAFLTISFTTVMSVEALRTPFLDTKLISYLDLDFSSLNNELINEIVIGPKADINDYELRLFLLSNGFNISKITIKDSNSPYL